MSVRAAIFTLLLGLGLSACGPRLGDLVAQHHYREAICGADDGWAADRASVAAALDRAAEPKLHVYVVRNTQLQTLLGAAADRIAARATFARVVVDTNLLPVDGIEAKISVEHGRSFEWDALLELSGEKRPPNRIGRNYLTAMNFMKALAVIGTGGVLLLSPIPPSFHGELRAVPPTDDDYREATPTAYAIHQAMAGTRCESTTTSEDSNVTGTRCTAFVAITRAPQVAPTVLRVTVKYHAARVPRDGRFMSDSCTVERTNSIDLGAAAELQTTTDRLFGDQLRAISELTH